ncbi:SWIM zinc finger family protein [Coleofasciculus sp. FACHB-SPT9]|uniref:SWIM zinc finger family protein n=1 Tax=Cyanophyceae TaxID=3028117 RepID=UPI0016888172|nr:SWIM zinc finger family protein [Coleofasciculus sp. FACHB-SPT9]MBD1890758.1 SWIM zinc finger family protein [Coleofasciculus sp. FACHB-SPT9]
MNNYEIQSREWWVQEWIDLLEKSRFKKRLERARNYAMQGNVLGIEFKGPKVLAKVQGTAPEPYQVSLSLDPFTDEQWDYVIETMSQRAIFSAQLLAGEMPPNIQEVFTANGLSIFPFTLSDIHARCSCPDKEIPCKHIGAVYYQLGDRFSEDPFVIFQLRGRPKEQILDTLRKLRRGTAETSEAEIPTDETSQPSNEGTSSLPATPLKIEQFWKYDEPLDSSLVVIAPTGDTVLNVLGSIPLSSGSSQPVMQYLDTVYQTVSQQAFLAAMNLEES